VVASARGARSAGAIRRLIGCSPLMPGRFSCSCLTYICVQVVKLSPYRAELLKPGLNCRLTFSQVDGMITLCLGRPRRSNARTRSVAFN
jgi:hypothetical protein